MKCPKCAKIKKYLYRKNQEYKRKGFGDYKDVEKIDYFLDTDLVGIKDVEKEIKRCRFLIDMVTKIEKIVG